MNWCVWIGACGLMYVDMCMWCTWCMRIGAFSLINEYSIRKKVNKLQPLQNRAVKIILNKYEYICTEEMMNLHSQLGLLTMGCRRKMFMLCLVFKYSKKQINLDEHRPDMVLCGRHKVKIKLAFSNKGRVLKSPYYLAVHLWNQLEVDVQMFVLYYHYCIFITYTHKL